MPLPAGCGFLYPRGGLHNPDVDGAGHSRDCNESGLACRKAMTNRSPSRAVSREFRNDTAAVVWIMVAVWIAMLACFSYVAWRDGGIPQVGRWAWPLLGLFWLCGVGAAAWAAGMPL